MRGKHEHEHEHKQAGTGSVGVEWQKMSGGGGGGAVLVRSHSLEVALGWAKHCITCGRRYLNYRRFWALHVLEL
jgi:hypothetical protein